MGRIRLLLADLKITSLTDIHVQAVRVHWSYPSLSQKCGFCGGIPCGESSANFKATAGFFLLPHLAEYWQGKSKTVFSNKFILIFQVLNIVSFSKYKKKKCGGFFSSLLQEKHSAKFHSSRKLSYLSRKKGLSPLLWGGFNKPVKPLTTQVGGRSQQRGT